MVQAEPMFDRVLAVALAALVIPAAFVSACEEPRDPVVTPSLSALT